MKKFLILTVILLALIIAAGGLVLPRMVESVIEQQIVNSTSSTAVDVSLTSTPNFKIAMGKIDKIHATAAAGRIGEVAFKNLTLDGESITLDVMELLFPNKDLSAQQRQQNILKRANKLELRGVITEDELKTFIATKDKNFENTQVSIRPEGAAATAKVKFLGRTIDLDIAGTFLAQNGDVYFHMTHLNSNSILSRVNVDTFLTDIKILDSSKLPLGLKFDSVELREGEAVITAVSTVK
jgi:hypothetical protein